MTWMDVLPGDLSASDIDGKKEKCCLAAFLSVCLILSRIVKISIGEMTLP
jgi:hypothetical protein